MTVLLKLLYAAAVTALFVLFVAFGIRTFYSPPEEPEFPRSLIGPIPVAPAPGVPGEPAPRPTLTPEQEQYQIEQQRYQDEYAIYRDELRDYRVAVLGVSALVGVAAVAAGVALAARLDALRLGLVGGGLGTLLFGVLHAKGDLDGAGTAVVFVVVTAGLIAVGAAGYRWLTAQDT